MLAQRFASTVGKLSGLTFSNASSHFDFSLPGLSLDQARLTNKAGQIVVDAESLHVPFSTLFSGVGAPIGFENAALHAYAADGREHFSVAKINGSSTLNSDGSFAASGTADIGQVHVIVEASLVSLARALNEGSPTDLTVSSKLAKAGYSGRLKLKDGFDLAGTMNLETLDAAELFAALGSNLSAMQAAWPLNITGAVETRDDALSFSNLEGQLGSMKALGNAAYSAPGGRPKLTLDLGMDVIDLSLFGLGAPSPVGAWSEKPYDLKGLDSLDAIWHISSNGLRFGRVEIGPGEFDGSLKDRILEASYSTKDVQVFSANFSLDAQGFQPAFDASFKASALDGKPALRGLTGFRWLTGSTSLAGKFSSTGDSPASMVSKLSGNLDVQVSAAQISGVDAASLLQSAATQPVEGWNGGVTDPVDGKASITFTDGIGSITDGSFTASNVSAKINGDVDVLRQAVEVKILPSFGGKPAAGIAASGHWDKPTFSADKSP
jgi:hypothetical protein